MTPEQRSERSRKGGRARWSPEARARARAWAKPPVSPRTLSPMDPAEQLSRATELATLTGGTSLAATMLITGAGPMRSSTILGQLEARGIVTRTPAGRHLATLTTEDPHA